MSVVERARIVRVPSEAQLERALTALSRRPAVPGGLGRGGPAAGRVRRARRRLHIARRTGRAGLPPRPPRRRSRAGGPAAARGTGGAAAAVPDT